MKATLATCPRCEDESRLRARDFSNQALAALVYWGEIDGTVIGKAICDACYDELREVLIERTDELGSAVPDGESSVAKAG